MHLFVFIISTLLLHSSLTSAVPSLPSLPSLKCLGLKNAIENMDSSKYAKILQREWCDHGCRLRASDYKEHLRDFATSVIEAESANMGAPELSPSYITGMDLLFDDVTEKCLDHDNTEEDLCQDLSRMAAVAQCAQKSFWPVAVWNFGSLYPLLVGDRCEKQISFFSDPGLLDKTFPHYVRQFSQVCQRSAFGHTGKRIIAIKGNALLLL
jgi:hypothetical protein